jgi:two-component system sensor histidine kinase BarA
MFKRIRHLKISLAAKCQLLFGAAVVLIIVAALYVPWQRMEQLMDQINVVSARTLADTAMAEHVSTGLPARDVKPTTRPSDQPVAKLVWAGRPGDRLSSLDRRALESLKSSPDLENFAYPYYREGNRRFRYAQPLYNTQDCLACHAAMTESTGMPGLKARTFGANAGEYVGVVTVDMKSNVEYGEILKNRVFILTAGVLAGTLAIVVFYLITTRLILQPVRVLQETAEKVSEGDLNIRSDISTGDEFQQLSETFNTMLSNLKQSDDQLRAINKALDTKLGQLAETNVALYESNRLKSEFLANVSHELRTPLNSILGFAELLKDGAAADAKSVRYIQNILQSGKNLLELINDLLDLAKIEAGRMEVRSEPLSLSDLFEGLNGILKPLLQSKDLTIEPEVGSDVPIIHTDPAKLQQVLYNFLSNAIKFSPKGGQIDLKAERNGEGQVKISVTDRGGGIEPEKQALIFEKFRQIDGSVTRQHSGTGLGLAISKELTTLLGGTIGVVSKFGEGATFWISLPMKITAGAQDVRGKMVLT